MGLLLLHASGNCGPLTLLMLMAALISRLLTPLLGSRCGESCVQKSAHEVNGHALQMFAELGRPESIMSDNGTVFHSQEFTALCQEWQVEQVLTGAYRPQGNGIIEWVHHTVKRVRKRTGGSVEAAVFWVNNTRGEHSASPYELAFGARSRLPGVTRCQVVVKRPSQTRPNHISDYADCARNPFVVGNEVYLPLELLGLKSTKLTAAWSVGRKRRSNFHHL